MGCLSGDQRQQLEQQLRQKASERGLDAQVQQTSGDDAASLGSLASALNGKGGGLSQMLNGGGSNVLSSPAAKAALAGIAAMAAKRFLKR
jgi:hypothetical protein